MLQFRILDQVSSAVIVGPRLGRLCRQGRKDILTPNYVAVTSRGVIPHLSQDTLRGRTDVNGVYLALEDCKLPSPRPHHLVAKSCDVERAADARVSD